MNTSLDPSQAGASIAVVITVLLFLKYMADERKSRDKSIEKLTHSIDKVTTASEKQMEASKKQREASHEVLIFMKRLNGKLENATIQKVAEQTDEHQTVKRVE